MDLAANGLLSKDICYLLHEHFSHHEVLLIHRVYNKSAHELARLGMSWDPWCIMCLVTRPPGICI